MEPHRLVSIAATPTVEVFRGITADRLDAPTPCAEYDVRALLGHLMYWGPSVVGAARKQLVPPPEQDVVPGAGWLASMEKQIDELVAVWSEPSAWVGMTRMGSPTELPAPIIGGMVLGELVVHGWDLARATRQHPQWDADVLAYTHEMVSQTAEQGRDMGVYGPAVRVPETALVLDRIIGMTGRDPGWTTPA